MKSNKIVIVAGILLALFLILLLAEMGVSRYVG